MPWGRKEHSVLKEVRHNWNLVGHSTNCTNNEYHRTREKECLYSGEVVRESFPGKMGLGAKLLRK